MSNQRLLIIFVKNQLKGKVKTRLAETVGDEQALRVYKKLTDYTYSVANAVDADRQVWYSDFIAKDDVWEKSQHVFSKKLQQGHDLGERMHTSFRNAFNEGYQKTVIIGSDCAELSADLISDSYQQLEDNDLVVGPSEDGGYYLLGMNKFYGRLLEDIPWSTPHVLPDTLRIAEEMELDIYMLPELNDVDNEEDWRAVKDIL